MYSEEKKFSAVKNTQISLKASLIDALSFAAALESSESQRVRTRTNSLRDGEASKMI